MDHNQMPGGYENTPISDGKRNQACERCWKRKQKCDRALPICSGCAAVETPCRGRKTDVAFLPEEGGLTHNSISSYIDSLKENVDKLEWSPRRKRARSNMVGTTMHGQVNGDGSVTTDRMLSPPVQGIYTEEFHDDRDGNGSVRATMGEIGRLSQSAMAEPRNDLARIISMQLSFEKMVVAAVSMNGPDPSSSTSSNKRSHVLKLLDTNNQPIKIIRETTSTFVSLFLDQALFLLPHLNPEQVIKDYEEVLIDHECERVGQSEMVSPCRYFRVYIVISLGILISQDSNTLDSVALNLHSAAMRLFIQIVKGGNDLATLNCILILTVYSIFCAHGGSAWHLLGLAMKKCIASRLHKENDLHIESSHDEIDEERKLFWSCYILDRTISGVLGRPFIIQDEDISALIPGEESQNIGSRVLNQTPFFQHLVMQAKLISSIRDCKESSIFHYGALISWRETYPNSKNATASSRHFCHHVNQLSCRTLTQLILSGYGSQDHSQSVLGSGRTIIKEVIASCVLYITQTCELSDSGNCAWSFVHAYDIFSAGVVLVGSWLNPRDDISHSIGELSKFVSKCTSLLTVISQRFSSLRQLRRVLEALLTWAFEEQMSTQRRHLAEYELLLHLPPIVPSDIRIYIQQVIYEPPPKVSITSVTGRQYGMTS